MSEPFELDAIERAVIEHLQRDGRTPYDQIATALGVAVEDVEARALAMQESGVLSVVAVTDPLQLGYARQAIFGVEVGDSVESVLRTLERMEEAIYVVHLEGEINVMVEVVGSSDAQLLELLARIRKLPGVRRIHAFLVTEVLKENYSYGTG